jgi:hypothetical protein
LWELIEREALYDCTEPHLAWVIDDLVERSPASVTFGFEFLFILEGTILFPIYSVCVLHGVSPVHISELIERENLTRLSDTSIGKKYWSTGVLEFYDDADNNKKRKKYDESAE